MRSDPYLTTSILCMVGAVVVACATVTWVVVSWVYRDAAARGRDGLGWALAVLVFGLWGLLLYLVCRPGGTLVPCRECERLKLAAAPTCLHCGARRKRRRPDAA